MKKNLKELLDDNGYYILKNIFSASEVKNYRKKIFNNLDLFAKSPNSRHLAGFHRYPEFISIQNDLLSNNKIQEFFKLIEVGVKWISIELTDITINRSQPWHTDLLRGKYKNYLDLGDVYGSNGGGVYKILLYLQKGKNLKIIPGSHKKLTPLDDSVSEKLASENNVKTVDLGEGDIIIMDVRLQHRGATENEMNSKEFDDNAKILIASVIGDSSKKYTHQMILGNCHRQLDWDEKFLPSYLKDQ